MTDSKQGTVPDVDPAPGLPVDKQRVFGNSPAARHPDETEPDRKMGRVPDSKLAGHSNT
jgi:hypothetical protein